MKKAAIGEQMGLAEVGVKGKSTAKKEKNKNK